MHYIRQCLEPARILNHIESISTKCRSTSTVRTPKKAAMIELQLTDKCNLNCFHCHFRDKGDVDLSQECLDMVLKEISPKAISIAGGGEPTLYPNFNATIHKIFESESHPKIGLITNGTAIPSGDWFSLLSWLRISLYSVIKGQYCGHSPYLQESVLKHIYQYAQMPSLQMLGIHLLYYQGNLLDCVELSYKVYELLLKSGRDFSFTNIQFKKAFGVTDPRLDEGTFQNDKDLSPSVDELCEAVAL